MIAGLDSATPPSASQLAQAKAQGVRLWGGYLATKAHVNLAHAWSKDDFSRVKAAGLATIAYCSGLDDPVACRNLAAAWGVPLCLDVESGIHGDGPWVQDWLTKSRAGLYGNAPVFAGRKAAFYVIAAFTNHAHDPGATWTSSTPRPHGPCGWQWRGTHDEFGVGVDRGWYDDWFATGRVDRWTSTGGAFSRDPVVVQNQDGRLEMLVTGDDGHLHDLAQTAPGSDEWWSAWVDLGGPPSGGAGNPAVTRNEDGRLEVLLRGSNGTIFHRSQRAPGGALTAWSALAGEPRNHDPVAVQKPDGRLQAFVIGDGGHLLLVEQDAPNGAWEADWTDLGGPPPGGAAGRLVVRRHKDGRLELLLRGTNGKIFHRTQQGGPGGPLTAVWAPLGADLRHHDPVAAQNLDGRLDAFVMGDDGRLDHLAQLAPNGAWAAAWKDSGGSPPGGAAGGLAVARNNDGRLELFVRGVDGHIYHRPQQIPGAALVPAWTSLGGAFTGSPVVGRSDDGRLEVFAVGKDRAIHRAAQIAPGRWA